MAVVFAVEERVSGVIKDVMATHGLLPPERGADLFAAGLNSMGMVALMLAVENEFDITIPVSELIQENFRSIRSVEALIGRLQRGGARAGF